MAKLFGEIAAKSLLTLDKSFARANGQPLDASEVYYSLEAAKTYAAGAQAYIGQKIVVVENGIVTHYGIEDAAGNLKELGSKPVGDNSSIVVAENGTISLKGVESLVFERDILDENDEPTGEKEAVQYQPLMTAAGLVWVEPSKTTVEGLATLIDALAVRVKALEDNRVTEEELAAAVKVEADRALAAEKALGERIDDIDFIDADELDEAIEAARELISAEIDEDVKVAKDRADAAYALAEKKVDAESYAVDKKAFQDEDAAIRAIAEGARDALDVFLNSEDIDDTVNTLKEIKAEIDKMTDATELASALASKADVSYVNEELGKKQDVIPENTYDAYGAAAAAKSEAIADAEGKIAVAKGEAIAAAAVAAEALYATKQTVSDLETAMDERLDALEEINHELYATKSELSAHEEAAAAAYATKEELKSTDDKTVSNLNAINNLTGRLDGIVAQGGEPNVINNIKVNGVVQNIVDKAVDVIVPTKVSDLTDDTGFDARITAAQNQADKGVNDAAGALAKANEAAQVAANNASALGELTTTVAGNTEAINGHGIRITALENADKAHASEYEALAGIVSGHTEAIAKKAESSVLDAVSAKASANESAIKTINETTLPGINAEVAKKANADSVYTKSEISSIIGEVEEGKTLVDIIGEAQTAATYDDTAIKASIKANADALAILNGSVESAGSVKAEAKAAADAAVALVVDSAPEAMDTLKEVADWIANDESGAAAMANSIAANTNAIAAINNADTGILAVAKKYADDAVAGIPVATAEVLGLVKFDNSTIKMNNSNQLYVAKITTDMIEQGSQTLILNGGSASD